MAKKTARRKSPRRTAVKSQASKKNARKSVKKVAKGSVAKTKTAKKKSTARKAPARKVARKTIVKKKTSVSKRKSVVKKKPVVRKKAVAKKAVKAKTKRKPSAAFMKAMTPSPALAEIVGKSAMPRTEIVKKLWGYIKKNKLQDEVNKRNINPDEKLAAVFGSKKSVNMFQMTKLISKHLQ